MDLIEPILSGLQQESPNKIAQKMIILQWENSIYVKKNSQYEVYYYN